MYFTFESHSAWPLLATFKSGVWRFDGETPLFATEVARCFNPFVVNSLQQRFLLSFNNFDAREKLSLETFFESLVPSKRPKYKLYLLT